MKSYNYRFHALQTAQKADMAPMGMNNVRVELHYPAFDFRKALNISCIAFPLNKKRIKCKVIAIQATSRHLIGDECLMYTEIEIGKIAAADNKYFQIIPLPASLNIFQAVTNKAMNSR